MAATVSRTTAETLAGYLNAANQANSRPRGPKNDWTRPGRTDKSSPNG